MEGEKGVFEGVYKGVFCLAFDEEGLENLNGVDGVDVGVRGVDWGVGGLGMKGVCELGVKGVGGFEVVAGV